MRSSSSSSSTHGAVDGDLHRDAVVDEHDAVAIEDPPARRLHRHDPDPVRLGRDLVLVGGHDLQVVEAREERGEEREHHDAEHRHPHAGRFGDHRYTARARTFAVPTRGPPHPSDHERRRDGVQETDDQGDPQEVEPDQLLSEHGADHAVQDDTDHARRGRGHDRDPPRGPEDRVLEAPDEVGDDRVGEGRQAERRLQEEVVAEAGGEADGGAPIGAGGDAAADRHQQEQVGLHAEQLAGREQTRAGW